MLQVTPQAVQDGPGGEQDVKDMATLVGKVWYE